MSLHCFAGISPSRRTRFRFRILLAEAISNGIIFGDDGVQLYTGKLTNSGEVGGNTRGILCEGGDTTIINANFGGIWSSGTAIKVYDSKATITNGKLNYLDRNINIDKLNATFNFTQQKFTVQTLSLIANKNALTVTGNMTDFIPFFTSPKESCKVKLNIVSPRLDMSGFSQNRKIVK